MDREYDEYKEYQSMLSSTIEIHSYREQNFIKEQSHAHDCFEIYYIVDGKARIEVDEYEHLLSKGEILLIPPLIMHSAEILSKSYEWIVLWMNPWYLSRMSSHKTNLTNCFAAAEQNGYLFVTEPYVKNRISSMLQELVYESREQEFGKDLIIDADIKRLLIMINRYMHLNIQKEKATLENVLRYINQHYTEQITLDFLCNKFYISKFYLSRSFERVVGKSIYQYILEKRMLMAQQLLICGEKPTDIYTLCGFQQYSNFYRAFKKFYQMSPSEFLKKKV